MNRIVKQSSSTWVAFLVVGFCSFLFSFIPPVSRSLLDIRKTIVTKVDTSSITVLSYLQTMQVKIRNDMDMPAKLSALEHYNRQLSADLVARDERIALLEQACQATASAKQKKETTSNSFLSKMDGKWIILSGSRDGVQVGQVVLLDNVYLGNVETVESTYSTLTTLGESQKPLLVLHENSRELALFTLEKGKFIIKFSSRVDPIHENDHIISVPDGKNSTLSYPVGAVQKLITTSSDSVTMAEIKILAIPKVGEQVELVQVQK